jgi:hypothetical protein
MATTVNLKPVETKTANIRIKSLSPMIQHKWSEKAKEMMRLKHAGKKTKSREARDPEQECFDSTYATEDGQFGIPVDALKASLIGAAHKDIGIEKTLVRKALFIHCEDAERVLAIESEPPKMREDCVRVGSGTADLRYRPEFKNWSAVVSITYDSSMLTPEDIINLINRAGFGVGIGEWRPEKGGEFGRFTVDTEFGIQ